MPAWDALFTKVFTLCNAKLETNVINSLKMQTKKQKKKKNKQVSCLSNNVVYIRIERRSK